MSWTATIPWAVFVIASLPAMAGALGSAGVALLAPLSVRLAERYDTSATGLIMALAISATVVDSTPFSTVGALVVANAADAERVAIYRAAKRRPA